MNYDVTIPASVQECEDALIGKLEALPDKDKKKREMSDLERKLMKQYYKTKSIQDLANVFSVAYHVASRWKHEIEAEEN